ncbi:hypothetical protein [uncultured Thiodictyon sp.]|uniref:hypothetical protein n=1 Tax=uncultured Thiodictyon sp. TaxID=1846217 RepID=UPI0025DA4533|nr:hypothetical protein [uncultured Thiodictyon sp.]
MLNRRSIALLLALPLVATQVSAYSATAMVPAPPRKMNVAVAMAVPSSLPAGAGAVERAPGAIFTVSPLPSLEGLAGTVSRASRESPYLLIAANGSTPLSLKGDAAKDP